MNRTNIMPKIVFNPDFSGGALKGDERARYMELCKQMTSRDPRLDYTMIRDEILKIIHKDVLEHIETLPKEHRPELLKDINTIMNNFDKTDMNQIATINIICAQLSTLFTLYTRDKTGLTPEEKADIFNTLDFDMLIKGNWKNYTDMKKLLAESKIFAKLVTHYNPSKGIPFETDIFLGFISIITISELIESYLNNIYYCGTSYTIDWIDGGRFYPLGFYDHDIFHYEMSESCRETPGLYPKLKEFRDFVYSNKDRPIQYSIDFVLFLFIHEESYCRNDDMIYINTPTEENVYDRLTDDIHSLVDLHSHGLGIPKKYRVLEEGDEYMLTQESVEVYLHLIAKRYVECWNEYSATLGAAAREGGGRRKRTRRVKKSRKVYRRTVRKLRKHRNK